MKKNNFSVIFSFFLLMNFLFSLYFSMKFYLNGLTYMIEVDLLNQVNSFIFSYLILLDWVSLLFMSVVSLISGVVMVYSYSYMINDSKKNSFYSLVLMFVLSMFLMVMSPQMLSILLGWDGLGLVSYCLVVYYNNTKSQNAGMVTFLSNRIGDLGIIISIAWLMNFGSMDLYIFQQIHNNWTPFLFFIIMVAAMTKSAQIPFSAWLPAAMAAPTPVSSLVHSSTLVTAGVYLLIRFNFLVSLNYYLLIFSCLTMIMSGMSALFETDMKKVIALSTLSQLGVMMFALSVGMKELSYFHLISHALFKSLLFLCAGFYIHSNFDWQDVRGFNKLYSAFPAISVYFVIASLSLSGFPFLSGFYSKDAIIEMFFINNNNLLILLLLTLATCLTLIYSVRLIYLTYMFKYITSPNFMCSKEDYVMVCPMFLLFMASITGGSLLSWVFFPCLFISLSCMMKLLILTLLMFLYIVSLMLYSMMYKSMMLMIYYLSYMWLTPSMTLSMMNYLTNKSLWYVKLFDQGWLEVFGGQGLLNYFSKSATKIDSSHLINMKNLLFLMSVTAFLLMII